MSNPVYNGSDKRLQQLFQNGGGGGGGTTVIANPSGEAADELEKLQVGETIYDIPTGGGGSSTLAGLSDVNLSSPTDGQVLTYDNGEWVNAAGGGSGSGGMCYLNTMYSETEEKVGYWIDGKPLYQKTIKRELFEGETQRTVSVNHGVSDMDAIRSIDMVIEMENGGLFPSEKYGQYYIQLVSASRSSISYYTTLSSYAGVHRYVHITIQYTKTTDSAEPNPQQGGVIYLPTIYSQEEREVGVWKDGKPLYQKTYAGLSLDCNYANTWYNTNILLGDIDVITSAELVDDNRQFIAGVVGTMSERTYLGVYLSISGRTITTITIQYTKTTDTAGSGSWTPSGAEAVHYSTNEQVVGTWIDGKTLYEATIEVNNPTKQTAGNCYYYEANYSGHNIDYVQCIAKQCHDAHDQRWYDLPYHRIIDTESIWCQGMKSDSSGQYSFSIFFRTSEQYSIDKIRYTIQYTKTS